MPVSEEVGIGTELLGYRVEELVGRGGMSVVYRATDLRLKRQVALKLLSPDLARDEGFRRGSWPSRRSRRRSSTRTSSPSTAPARRTERLYIAMRYVEDGDLKRLLRREAPLKPERSLELLGEVADALDAAHERGLVHRDVKPSNILISVQAGKEHSYLADFGLTLHTSDRPTGNATTQIVGTVDYVAPEQIAGDDVDARADVYALGCVLYECLTGEVPFPRDSDLAALWAHMRTDPPRVSERRPDLPEAIDAVVSKALAKDPQKRYGSCGELVESARQALGLSDVRIVRATPAALAGCRRARGERRRSRGLRARRRRSLPARSARELARADRPGDEPRQRGDRRRATSRSASPSHGDTAWVYNLGDGTVSQIDTSTNRVRRTTPVSSGPVTRPSTTSGPLLAANSAGAWLVGIRPDGKGVVTRIGTDGRRQELVFDASPVGVAASETAVWVLGVARAAGRCPYAWPGASRRPAATSSSASRRRPGASSSKTTFPACVRDDHRHCG